MPGVSKDGTPNGSYSYDVGGGKKPISGSKDADGPTREDREYNRGSSPDGPAPQYGKLGHESSQWDKDGNRKNAKSSDVNFLEGDGSWAPAEGRGSVGSRAPIPRNQKITK